MPFDFSKVAENVVGGVATQGLGQLTSMGLGLMLEKHNDKRQLRQQEALQNLQIKGARELTDYQQLKQLEMWEKTGYGPQMKQMIEAGLNPALMYGMKGGGGMTIGGGIAQPSGGGNAPAGGGEQLAMQGMGMQMQLLRAQKENIEADTQNKLADAKKKSGVDTEEAESRIGMLLQQTDNERLKWDLMNVEKGLKELEKYKGDKTVDEVIEQIKIETSKAKEVLTQLKNDSKVSSATVNSAILEINQKAIGAVLDNKLKQWNIELAPVQLQKLRYEATQIFMYNDTHYDELAIKKKLGQIARDNSITLSEQQQTQLIGTIGNLIIGAFKATTPDKIINNYH